MFDLLHNADFFTHLFLISCPFISPIFALLLFKGFSFLGLFQFRNSFTKNSFLKLERDLEFRKLNFLFFFSSSNRGSGFFKLLDQGGIFGNGFLFILLVVLNRLLKPGAEFFEFSLDLFKLLWVECGSYLHQG